MKRSTSCAAPSNCRSRPTRLGRRSPRLCCCTIRRCRRTNATGSEVDHALALAGRTARADQVRAAALKARNQPAQATALLEQARKQHPDQPGAWTALALDAARGGDAAKAAAILGNARQKLGDKVEFRLAALQLIAGAEGATAAQELAHLEKNLEAFTPQERALLLSRLAETYYRRGQSSEGDRLCRQMAAEPATDLIASLALAGRRPAERGRRFGRPCTNRSGPFGGRRWTMAEIRPRRAVSDARLSRRSRGPERSENSCGGPGRSSAGLVARCAPSGTGRGVGRRQGRGVGRLSASVRPRRATAGRGGSARRIADGERPLGRRRSGDAEVAGTDGVSRRWSHVRPRKSLCKRTTTTASRNWPGWRRRPLTFIPITSGWDGC